MVHTDNSICINLQVLSESQSFKHPLRPCDIRPRSAGEPFDVISIANTHQFTTVRLPSRARERLTKVGETRQPLSHSVRVCNHATDVLISEVAGRPAIGAMRSRGERDENVELAGAGDGRGGIEVKAASLALGLGWEVEGEERCDVGLATILEYFAIDLVAADGTGPHVVLGGNAWPYGRILGIGGGKFWVFSARIFGLRAWGLRTTGRSSGRLGSAGRA